jgi:putative ABC transport system substrate-binding protein
VITRRRFLTGSVIALTPIGATASAQEYKAGRVYRVAIVSAALPVAELKQTPNMLELVAELRRLGYVEGQNLAMEFRSAGGRREDYPKVARDVLVELKPDVIIAGSGILAQAFRATSTIIPIVTTTSDPIGLRLAESLARPGTNVTGVTVDTGSEILGKRLELLKEAAPKASRFAYLSTQAGWDNRGEAMQHASNVASVTLFPALLNNPIEEHEYRRAFTTMIQHRVEALVVSDHAEGLGHQKLIVELAMQARLPAIYPYQMFAASGGLMAYGASQLAISRQTAGYVDRILKGAKPAELPFQQPTTFDLVINLKTAKTLGLTIPPSLLARADQVIE